MTKDITTTERVIGFAKEFIGCILDDHGYDLEEIQYEDKERYVIEHREPNYYILGKGHSFMSLDEVAEWIDSELYSDSADSWTGNEKGEKLRPLSREELYKANLNAFAEEINEDGFIHATTFKNVLYSAYKDGLLCPSALQALEIADGCTAFGDVTSDGEEIVIRMNYDDVVRCTGILS